MGSLVMNKTVPGSGEKFGLRCPGLACHGTNTVFRLLKVYYENN